MNIKELGFTEEFLKSKWDEVTMDAFLKFMRGQTVSIIDGQTVYYYFDVKNFCARYDVNWPNPKN